MESKKEKAKNFLQRMYHLRVKVDRKGTPIVNVSSIFGLACLLFAPHMTLVGVVASLILGYQIHFENEEDDAEIQEQIRVAAQNMKNGVVNAAKSIQQEIDRRTAGKPEEAQTKPAPAEIRTFCTWMTKPSGAPISCASSEKLYCVFAIQIGRLP